MDRLRRVDAAMVLLGGFALGGLVFEYGFGAGPDSAATLHAGEKAVAAVFCMLQALKLFLVQRPLSYLRRRWFDFALTFVLAFQLAAAAGLELTPEHAYLDSHGAPAPLAAASVLMVQAYFLIVALLRSSWLQGALLRLRLHPAQTLLASFAALIAAGTAALCLPKAVAPGRELSVLDALFTATSAACVTGLTVVDTGTHFSTLGQCVILALIQAGGLGILTLTALAAVVGGRGVLGTEAREMGRLLEVRTVPEIRRALVKLLAVTLLAETVGAALLFGAFAERARDPFVGAFYAIFHSVSAFCNAGFSLFPDSLASFRGNGAVMAVFCLLILAGSLGVGALVQVPRAAAGRWSLLPRHVRVVLSANLIIIPLGAVAFFLMERGGTLRGLSGGEAFWTSVFVPITTRTCGFDVGGLAGLGLPSVALMLALMFVGGAPASTAGGIKVTALSVLGARLRGLLSRRPPELAGLPLDEAEQGKAAWVALGMGGVVLFSAAALMVLEGRTSAGLLFEAVSAAGTVGLTLGETPVLSAGSKLVLVLTMLAGRVGPACLVLVWLLRHPKDAPGPDPVGIG